MTSTLQRARAILQATATYQEITSQPDAWLQAYRVVSDQSALLKEFWQDGSFSEVIFTGCGSTYHLSTAAASLFQQLTGSTARSVPAGELVLYPETAYAKGARPLLVAISRSGRTTETRTAVERFRKSGQGSVLTITNYGESPIASLGSLNIVIPAGQEQSIAQTRSFASMYVASSAITAVLAGDDALMRAMQELPTIGRRLIEQYEPIARAFGADASLDRFYFLGSGPRFGLACEANLKMKEMSLTHSEAFHFMEFRHGPMSMITDTAAVIGLLSMVNRKHEQAVIDEMKSLGARTLMLADTNADVSFNSGVPEPARNVLYLPILQLTALYRATSKGLDPDHPNNLTSVVELTSLAAL